MSLLFRNSNDYPPFFRLVDELDRATNLAFQDNRRSFAPRFDVKETKTSYELHGELPGIERSNINIEWSDNNTLVISGHTEKASEYKSSGMVENAGESGNGANRSKETTEKQDTTSTSVAKSSDNKELAKQSESAPRYWITERSSGSFHRTFQFPDAVDHEHATASLKDGILSIVVPRVQSTGPRKITIE